MQIKSLLLAVLILGLLAACSPNPAPMSTAVVTYVANQTPVSVVIGGATPNPSVDKVIISEVTKDAAGLEMVTIKNISDEAMDITGYFLYMSSTTERFKLPEVKLEPGETYHVYNGPGAKDQPDGTAWRDEAALQVQGDDITLLNTAGRMIWAYVYYP